MTQRFDWVDLRGAECRNEACNQCHAAEDNGEGGERWRVSRIDAIKQTFHQTRECEGASQARPEPERDKPHPFLHNESKHIPSLRTEREADSKFARSLSD